MSVQNVGAIIREARLKARLTQEQLSEGICSALSLSRIENGMAGVSPSTFQALMAHAGADCEAYPVFASHTDFDCFYTLKRARFFLDSWQLRFVSEELDQIEEMGWADNKFYYQEWLMLQCRLQFRSGCGDHRQIYDAALDAWRVSRPDFDAAGLGKLLLSSTEIELCTLLAQEALYLGELDTCLIICTQISSYLSNTQISFLERDRLLAENAIVYCKYLISAGDYQSALQTADTHRHRMVQDVIDAPLHELTFLTALGYYYIEDTESFWTYFKMAFLSAHSIGSCYATICRAYVTDHLDFTLPEELSAFEDIPLVHFPSKKAIDAASMGDGTYDFFSSDILTLGGLIRALRTEQNLSQETLCRGLCSNSKLSKIENGTLQPEITLSQLLLQRLGISDLVFPFYGNGRESALEELMLRLSKVRTTDRETILQLADEMIARCTPKDSIYLQYALFKKSARETTPSGRITGLTQALEMTLPGFDFGNIQSYHLSWMEMTILNSLCSAYVDENPSIGIRYFYKLLEYCEGAAIDCLESKRFWPVTLGILVRCLYSQKRYAEVMELSKCFSSPVIRSSIYFTGNIFFHYCQSLGEIGEVALAEKYGNYASQNCLISENPESAQGLKTALYRDFQILL